MLQTVDSIIYPRWVVPVVPRGEVLSDHAVVIRQGLIQAICPAGEATNHYRAGHVVDLPEHLLMPGLINAHGHAAMSLLRGIGDDMPLMPWLEQRVWPAERAFVDRDFVADGTELAIAEMISGGTTCANDMYFFAGTSAEVAIRCGFRMTVGLVVFEFPTAWASSADEYISKGLQLHDRLRPESLINTTLAPHAPYTVSDETFRRVHTLSDQLDLPVHVHLHETAEEIEQSRREHGLRPFARLHKLGLVNEHLLAVHMTQLTDEEIAACARLGVTVLHCPESNQKLASGFCPVERLRQAGINVALGTDGAASNNDLDMFGEMRSAALMGKLLAADATAIPAPYALEMATINGARALGMEDRIGSIEPGKAADMTAICFDRIDLTPAYDVISHLVYAAHRRDVTDVWVQGRRVLDTGRLTSIDERDLLSRARRWGERVQSSLAQQDHGESV